MRECNFSYFSVFCTQLIKPRTKLWKILAPPGVAPIQQNRFQLCTINCTEKLHWNEIYFYLALFTSLMTFSQTNSLSFSLSLICQPFIGFDVDDEKIPQDFLSKMHKPRHATRTHIHRHKHRQGQPASLITNWRAIIPISPLSLSFPSHPSSYLYITNHTLHSIFGQYSQAIQPEPLTQHPYYCYWCSASLQLSFFPFISFNHLYF